MRIKLSSIFILLLLFSKGFAQPDDSLHTMSSDSLNTTNREDTAETVEIIHPEKYLREDEFKDELVGDFSLPNKITWEDIDNSICEDIGDLFAMRTLIDVVKTGSSGQLRSGSLAGDMRGLDIFIDGIPYKQQDLCFPQGGSLDLNSVLLSNVAEVKFLPGGLTSLWGGNGILGANIITKDFEESEPYSRAAANWGPQGFRRTQVELGRGLGSNGKFYFTGEFKKSDGYLTNSDYDGMSLSGKTTFKLKKRMDLKLDAYQYKTDMGLISFPEAKFNDIRKKVSNWGTGSTLLFRENQKALLNVGLRYERQNQKVKSKGYDFEIEKIEETIGLRAIQNLTGGRNRFRIEGYGDRKSLKSLTTKDAVYGGFVSVADLHQLSPTISLLLSSRIGKEKGLDAGISASGGLSYSVSKGVKLFWTVGRSVGYPTLMDRFWPPLSFGFKDVEVDYQEEGNALVKPQKSYVADFGASVQKKNCRIGVYLFGSTIDDFILWSNVDTTTYYGYFKPLNTEARIWGTNVNVESEFFDHVKFYVSYSFKQSQDSDREIKLPYSPDHSLFSYIQFENEFLKREIGLKLRLEANVISDRFLKEYEQDKEPGVAILNTKITIRFLDFHFHYEVRNLTDQAYRLRGDYFMPGRSFWWGFYWEFFD